MKILTFLLAVPCVAYAGSPPTALGKYEDWDGGEIDEVQIVQPTAEGCRACLVTT